MSYVSPWTTRPRRPVDISGFDLRDTHGRRNALLVLVRAGYTVTEAAPMVFIAVSSVHSACAKNPAFAAKLEQARRDAQAMDPRKLAFLDLLAQGESQATASIIIAGTRAWSHSARRSDPAFDDAVRQIVPAVNRASNGRDIEAQFEVYALAARIIGHLQRDGISVAEACRREGVSHKTVSAWNKRRPYLHGRIMESRAEHVASSACASAAQARWAKWRAERETAA